LAEFFRDMYWMKNSGPGWNVRTLGVTKTIPLIVVEAGVRSKVGWDAWQSRGSLRLPKQEGRKCDEMLLAANGIVAAVTTGQAVVECLTTGSPLGLRAINPHMLVRTGQLGVRFLRARREDAGAAPPSWEELAQGGSWWREEASRLGPYAI
jgi:hypothetical protein